MRLDDLIDGIEILDMGNLFPDMEISSITSDSRKVIPGCAFVAVTGEKADGHEFVDDALQAGATIVIQSRPLDPGRVGSFIRVADSRSAYALAHANLWNWPSRRLRVIGITGTNGKTTTALLARQLLNGAGWKCAALGTLGLIRPGATEFEQRGLTTPDAGRLQETLAELADAGATHLVMEVSSHAISQERVTGIEFTGAVFTNITQDHFDYHGTFAHYRQAKEMLFNRHLVESGGYAVVNIDDPVGAELTRHCPGVVVTFGETAKANLVLTELQSSLAGNSGRLVIKNGVWPDKLDLQTNLLDFSSPMAGRHNAFNCAAAAGIALLEGLELTQISQGLASFAGVPGRLQRVDLDSGVVCFVDYAHTPDALINVLLALAELRQPGGRIITVFGCGGDRDRTKRPIMGGVVMQHTDLAVVTSDNPRTEDPESIIDEIMQGIDDSAGVVLREPDRRRAIELAVAEARPGDIVLVAGKGHEDYQIIGERSVHFSDVEELQRIGMELAAL